MFNLTATKRATHSQRRSDECNVHLTSVAGIPSWYPQCNSTAAINRSKTDMANLTVCNAALIIFVAHHGSRFGHPDRGMSSTHDAEAAKQRLGRQHKANSPPPTVLPLATVSSPLMKAWNCLASWAAAETTTMSVVPWRTNHGVQMLSAAASRGWANGSRARQPRLAPGDDPPADARMRSRRPVDRSRRAVAPSCQPTQPWLQQPWQPWQPWQQQQPPWQQLGSSLGSLGSKQQSCRAAL
jgi:hypothetical protein